MKRVFPQLFERHACGRCEDYPHACSTLRSHRAARRRRADVRAADAGRLQLRLLRARLPGAADGRSSWSRAATWSSTTTRSSCARPRGLQRVDVIYRRIDDDFLDPLAFRPDCTLGVPGPDERLPHRQRRAGQRHRHRRGRRQGDLRLRAADDPLLPGARTPILPNVQTYLPPTTATAGYVLENLDELVVKAVNEAGGYGMLIGPLRQPGGARGRSPRRSWPSRAATSPSR